jgi:hypothetical protein
MFPYDVIETVNPPVLQVKWVGSLYLLTKEWLMITENMFYQFITELNKISCSLSVFITKERDWNIQKINLAHAW